MLLYDSSKQPSTADEYDGCLFHTKVHWGFYTWPEKFTAYAPIREQNWVCLLLLLGCIYKGTEIKLIYFAFLSSCFEGIKYSFLKFSLKTIRTNLGKSKQLGVNTNGAVDNRYIQGSIIPFQIYGFLLAGRKERKRRGKIHFFQHNFIFIFLV